MKSLLLFVIVLLPTSGYSNPYELTEHDLLTLSPDECYEKALKYREYERQVSSEQAFRTKVLVSTYQNGKYWKKTYKQVDRNKVVYTTEDSNGETSTYTLPK